MKDDTILVVDDDDNLRDLVRFVLEPTNDVVEAATCAEAIAVLQANHSRVCMVLLDYIMPGMDPVSCAMELRRLAGSAMIVLCTAAANPAERAAEVGLTRWLAKPFSLDTLRSLAREAAARRHQLPSDPPSGARRN